MIGRSNMAKTPRFSSPRIVVTRTPLRVSFAGGGTDLAAFYEQEHGAVFSTAINKYIYVTVKRHGEVFNERIRLNYSRSEQVQRYRRDRKQHCSRVPEVPAYRTADLYQHGRGSAGLNRIGRVQQFCGRPAQCAACLSRGTGLCRTAG